MSQYKKLRNLVNSKIRKETISFNSERVPESKSEKEMWNVINDVTSPKSNLSWCIKTGDTEITDHLDIANSFNEYFITKIENLKKNIVATLVEDPNSRIKKDIQENKKHHNRSFTLKRTNEKEVKKP